MIKLILDLWVQFAQVILILVSIFFIGWGWCYFSMPFLQIIKSSRKKARIVEVKAALEGNAEPKMKHPFSNKYYPVYAYKGNQGQVIRASSIKGNIWAPNNILGQETVVFVSKNDERAPFKPDYTSIVAAIFSFSIGALFLNEILQSVKVNLVFFIALFGVVLFMIIRKEQLGLDRIFLFLKKMPDETLFEKDPAEKTSRALHPKEFQMLLKQHDRAAVLWAPAILLITGFMLTLGLNLYVEKKSYLQSSLKAKGLVLGVVNETQEGGGNLSYPRIQFKTQDGKVIRFKDSLGKDPAPWSRGEVVDVIYSPTNPKQAEMDRGIIIFLPAVLLLLIGGLWTINVIGNCCMSLARLLKNDYGFS